MRVLFMAVFSPLPSLLAEDTARERPLGRTTDIETGLEDSGSASLHEVGQQQRF
jgi:hypothetical protein